MYSFRAQRNVVYTRLHTLLNNFTEGFTFHDDVHVRARIHRKIAQATTKEINSF